VLAKHRQLEDGGAELEVGTPYGRSISGDTVKGYQSLAVLYETRRAHGRELGRAIAVYDRYCGVIGAGR